MIQVMTAECGDYSTTATPTTSTTNATNYTPFRTESHEYFTTSPATQCDYGSTDSCLELLHHEDVRGVNETRRIVQSSPNPYYDDDDDETSKS
jgi:hypothetical protein